MLVDPPSEQWRKDYRVAQATDREKLGDPLQNSDKKRLERVHGAQASHWLRGARSQLIS
jgi:hypothetical protein